MVGSNRKRTTIHDGFVTNLWNLFPCVILLLLFLVLDSTVVKAKVSVLVATGHWVDYHLYWKKSHTNKNNFDHPKLFIDSIKIHFCAHVYQVMPLLKNVSLMLS